jgi:hypothetical protein
MPHGLAAADLTAPRNPSKTIGGPPRLLPSSCINASWPRRQISHAKPVSAARLIWFTNAPTTTSKS